MNNNQLPKQNEARLKVLARINELESKGLFNEEVEENPPYEPLKPNEVDYLHLKFRNKLSSYIAIRVAKRYIEKLMKQKKLLIKEVKGYEKIANLKTGFILTCNHFNPFDNFALHMVFKKQIIKEHRHFFKVIREGNYRFPGIYGYFFRNCDTLPLSANFQTMKAFNYAIETILKRGDIVLIYPEQAMWWNYRKPRPLKPGAFKYAQRVNVPVVPCFITMEDSNEYDEDGFLKQIYTINFSDPLYPDQSLSAKDAAEDLCTKNYEVWKQIYEDFYQMPLTYDTIKSGEEPK